MPSWTGWHLRCVWKDNVIDSIEQLTCARLSNTLSLIVIIVLIRKVSLFLFYR